MVNALMASRKEKSGGRREPAWRGLLRLAISAHQGGDLAAAEKFYKRILKLQPNQPDVLHFYGVLCHQRGRSDEAVDYITRALKKAPGYTDAHNNLGNVHKECERLEEAERSYLRALECSPDHHHAMSNLGVLMEVKERLDDAHAYYAAAIDQVPEYALGHRLMAMFLTNYARDREDMERALEHYRQAYAFNASDMRSLESIGVLLYTLGRSDEATQVYRDWAARDPDHPVPKHMLAACGAVEAPSRCDDDYVRTLFDGFADSFDEQLIQNLGYRAPQILIEALAPVLPSAPNWDVLDAGCGTGLCAPLLRPHARHLAGVDLSPGMVEKATARGGYDELEVAELTAFMQSRRDAYDAIVSADTLLYFGDLQDVLCAAWNALHPGGWLAFTVEALPDESGDMQLTASGRYQHGKPYLERCLAQARFDVVSLHADVLRQESGKPVNGWIVVARHPVDPH